MYGLPVDVHVVVDGVDLEIFSFWLLGSLFQNVWRTRELASMFQKTTFDNRLCLISLPFQIMASLVEGNDRIKNIKL